MKAHICIGGPLDGEWATSSDFHGDWISAGADSRREDGMYEHLSREYFQFNTARHQSTVFQHPSRKKGLGRVECHVVWLHRSLLQSPKSPRER